jgi:hypothetical protein
MISTFVRRTTHTAPARWGSTTITALVSSSSAPWSQAPAADFSRLEGNEERSRSSNDEESSGSKSKSGGHRSGFYGAYLGSLEKNPIMTNAATAFVLSCAGDSIAQSLDTEKPFDLRRMLACAGFNVALSPVMRGWFVLLDKLFAARVTKVLVNQTFFSTFANSMFFGWSMYFNTDSFSLENWKGKLERDLAKTQLAAWMVWPAINMVTFSLPLPVRVAFLNTAAMFWTVYLSLAANSKGQTTTEALPAAPQQGGSSLIESAKRGFALLL